LIRKDLLDKKGLGIPETVDDWYNALLAFKSLGVKAPFTKAKGYLADFIARAYGIQLDADAWYIEDGKVVYGPVQPAYKDFLATWHKWYDEGLIDPDIATVDANIETAKMADGSAAATFNYVSRVYNYNKAAQEKIQGYNIVAAPFPVLKKGDAYEYSYISNLYSSSEVLTVITGNCKHPEIAARFLDYLWGEEGNILANWGIPDVTYTTGANKEPKYTDFLLKNPDGWTMSQVRGGYMRSYSSGPYVQDKRIDIQTYVMPEQVTAVDMWSKNASMKHLMPPIARTAQENTEYATIMSEVETYYKECLLKFMIGTMKLDEYDAYKAQMKNLKIDRAIEIQQAAYNRYISK
jgi:putative aldouronate transport system substrate-binding protein